MPRHPILTAAAFALALTTAQPAPAQTPAITSPAPIAAAQPTHQTSAEDLTDRLAACNACHGSRGEGLAGAEYNPHLAGKPAGYLAEQLRAFRDGLRVYPQMTWLLRNTDDAYIDAIAAHYAAMPPRTRPDSARAALDPAATARAHQLVFEGDPARGVPACAACHGSALTGVEPGIPALVGLPAEYVVAQFGAWRTGVRRARAPDCMADIASALDPTDVRLIATWLAAQGHAEPMPPAPAGSLVPPVDCGALHPMESSP